MKVSQRKRLIWCTQCNGCDGYRHESLYMYGKCSSHNTKSGYQNQKKQCLNSKRDNGILCMQFGFYAARKTCKIFIIRGTKKNVVYTRPDMRSKAKKNRRRILTYTQIGAP
eukprot:675530_1